MTRAMATMAACAALLWAGAAQAMNAPGTGICDPIAGLTDCQTDSDCVVVDAIGCCPCWMGGAQGAIRNDKQSELWGQLAVCCQDLMCLAVFLCQDVEARCQGGTCTLVTATAIPTPAPTAAPMSAVSACYGDCNGDGHVTVDEILLMVNMALGDATSNCAAADVHHDGMITVAEILTTVNDALSGCP